MVTRRADVDAIGLDIDRRIDLDRGHARGRSDELGKSALTLRGEMHDHHEGASAVGGHMGEEPHDGFHAARRGAERDREEARLVPPAKILNGKRIRHRHRAGACVNRRGRLHHVIGLRHLHNMRRNGCVRKMPQRTNACSQRPDPSC
jgi:hypothetical protein